MPKVEPEIEAFARIKVIGVGGSGLNAINHMISSKVKGVEFIAMNTDAQHLHHSLAQKKIHLGKNLTKGLGAGMNPEIGKRAAEETKAEIQGALKGADMVFIACGMGGGTGTGAAPVVARTSREEGALTVAVVTRPFFFEGAQRGRLADQGLDELKKEVDAIIVIPNDRLLGVVGKDTTFKSAFAMCDEILRNAVEGISDLITIPGIINVDFADIKAVMSSTGSALMGIGYGSGENRARDAAMGAINSPLLDISISGARGVLFAIAGGDDLTMNEVQDAAKTITESIDTDAKVIFGAVKDDRLKKSEIKVTVIATGFPETGKKSSPQVELIRSTPVNTAAPEKERREIHNILPQTAEKTPMLTPTSTPSPSSSKIVIEDDSLLESSTDDWNAVPAFLRRGKK
ncbi:MAG: cell division protein FtsZ [Candidatus Yonathbacteria bacterium RIFCSPHIGHO2_01_FULL_51_10]|uniref:Cell division protein FtsZ n=1 Tax=Candidatus Yonathbacteria bacterium RIFCSPHIGHO2_01_FULL_51_10 TaxID=1802723 RepID=A0A1G2S5Y2_9BACT|nr:MAG: cell division protein FtsZ [Candidatus Yonathbacteria bacterium RIFCSPHIGHO2_01_FULL_51_10]